MSLLGIGSIAELINSVVDKIWPDADTREKAKAEIAKAELEGKLKELDNEWSAILQQIEVNKAEANHSSVFVAGARPATLWVCALGLAYEFLIQPIISGLLGIFGLPPFPAVNTEALNTLLMGLLGLGGFRTFERIKGVERNRLK